MDALIIPDTTRADPARFEQEMREATSPLGKFFHGGTSWKYWIVNTRAGQWQYRYSVKKNKAGFFLGEIKFIHAGPERAARLEGLFARRSKKRVMEIQRRRAQKHKERIKSGG